MKKNRQANSQLHIILNSIADGVFTIDREKNITSFNRAAEKITGLSADEVIGLKCFDAFHSNICQNNCALDKTVRTGKEIIDLPVNILDSKGRNLPISISTAVVKDEKGEIIGGVETFRDLSTIEEMRKELLGHYTFQDIISKNHEIHNILNVLPDIAESGSTVLIQGPSGSGKELFARAIHNCSAHKNGPYVAVNCGAIPDNLLESELFGYQQGAFTDAKKDKPGRFALAKGGTLFLDEIGDISIALQVKLLRVLQEGEYEPLGSTKPHKANARIIVATNKNLKKLMASGRFRDDLYYRLNVIKIELPPLAKHKEDIPLLVEHIINHLNIRMERKISGLSSDAMKVLMSYDYPGNIRELENIIEHGFVLCRGSVIKPEHLSHDITERVNKKNGPEELPPMSLRETEEQLIKTVLKKNSGHRGKTAAELGIDKSTLWRKMKNLGIGYDG